MKPISQSRADYQREWRRKNAAHLNALNKVYREKNRERLREKQNLYRAANRELMLERKRKYRAANGHKIKAYTARTKRERKDYMLRTRFGITLVQYEALAAAQNNRCGICRKEAVLVVDHCHTTGKIRGLLCSGCNKGLGLLGDSFSGVRAAAHYLEKSSAG